MSRLRISEIFHSLQGESTLVGLPTVFVRLTGCPLRCGYCDTTYAFKGGTWMEMEQVLAQVESYAAGYVTVTGGEPLAQVECRELLTRLCDAGQVVSLETSGALDVSDLDPRVILVMDLKTPGSGECDRNLYSNLQHLKPNDQLKFVLCDRADYDWAKQQIIERDLSGRCELLLSPVAGSLDPAELAQWILDDRLPVRFQLQLHKILWGNQSGR